jgi:hypothetical protein
MLRGRQFGTVGVTLFLAAQCAVAQQIGAAGQSQSDQQPITAKASLDDLDPLIPPGISDFNLEVYGKYAYTWTMQDGTRVVEVLGDASTRLGQHRLTGHDAVFWFRNGTWNKRPYLDIEVFLWQDAQVVQPGGTVESGPALLVTMRTFGKLVINADAHAAQSDADGELFKEATRARRLLEVSPTLSAEEAGEAVRVAPTTERLRMMQPKVLKKVDFTAEELNHEQHEGQSIIVAVGEVRVSQGSPADSGEYVELRADGAVLYLNRDQATGKLPGLMGQDEDEKVKKKNAPSKTPQDSPSLGNREKDERAAAKDWVEAVYLEGDVVLTRGQRMIRAPKLYYDFQSDRALILDAVTHAVEPSRGLPIYVRAMEIRQLSATEYFARDAQVTTSEFKTPHVAIGAEKVYLTDRTPRDANGQIIGIQAGTYKAYNTTMNIEGTPVLWWPFSRGDFSRDRMALRSAKVGYNGDFGASFETKWYLFNLMGLEAPEGYDATLKMDYFTDRGPATGIDMDYEREDYFGLVRSYYINDQGSDQLGPERSGDPPHDDRGRFLARHRQILPKGWELSLEASYLSDTNFLEQYERNEFENGKDQETLAYLVKRQDNWQFSTLMNWRINDFQTQTEHFPDAMFSLIGEPLGEYATLYSESRLGAVRYKYDSDSSFGLPSERPNAFEDSGSVLRGDTREEITAPLPELGPVKLTPYVAGRVTGWDDNPDREYKGSSGGMGRAFGSYGIRGNMFMTKVDETIESSILDLHRLRHVIKPDFAVWNAHANRDPQQLTPFDSGVEDIADAGGGTVGLRQKFQTQRGGPGKWRTVDWIVLDVEGGFFTNSQYDENTHGDYIASRPEDSISSNFIATNFQYRISDSTVIVHDSVFDTNTGNMGTSNISLAVEREPRMAYFVGWRYIHDTNSNLIAFGGNYKLSEKHSVAVREMYDIEEGRNYQTELAYIRKWPRWYSAVALDVDRGIDDVGITFSVWPEGAPRIGLGSKRYTGLTDSVGIRPQ